MNVCCRFIPIEKIEKKIVNWLSSALQEGAKIYILNQALPLIFNI